MISVDSCKLEGSREGSRPRHEEDASDTGGQEEASKFQDEAHAKEVCWATGDGQGPPEVAGPARIPGQVDSSENAVCQAEGEEEARYLMRAVNAQKARVSSWR